VASAARKFWRSVLWEAIASVLGVALMTGSLYLFASTIHSVVESHWPGPTQDSWHFIASLKMFERGESVFRELLKPHAGHRIF
jgi:hypothetical protein